MSNAWSYNIKSLFGLTLLFLLVGCSNSSLTGNGGGSEAGNAFAGTVIRDGETAAGATAYLLPKNFNPMAAGIPDEAIAISDSKGQFHFENIEAGEYQLEIRGRAGEAGALITNIEIPEGDTTQIVYGDIFLLTLSNITLKLESSALSRGTIFLPGTSHKWNLSDEVLYSGEVDLRGLPPASYNPRFTSSESDGSIDLLPTPFTLAQGENVSLEPLALWEHKKELNMNIPAENLRSTLYNFPAALRFTDQLIAFEETQDNGEDFRIVNSEGKPISFEIESWDKINKRAMVWMTMDSVNSNSSSSPLTFFWGNPNAVTASNPASVFSSEKGYAAVWHMAERNSSIGEDNIYANASENENEGADFVASDSSEFFLGNTPYITQEDFIRVLNPTETLQPQELTFSAWIKTDPSDTLYGTVAEMEVHYGMRFDRSGTFRFFIIPDSTFKNVVSPKKYKDGQWHYMVGTYDGNQMKLYVDGEEVASKEVPGGINYESPQPNGRTIRPYFHIGMPGAQTELYNYEGYIDEIRVSNTARSADWIRMNYELQKPEFEILGD